MRQVGSILAVAAVLFAALLFDARTSVAKPDYSRRSKKECSYCHPPGGWELNDAGRYYRDHNHTLDGFTPSEPPTKPKLTASR